MCGRYVLVRKLNRIEKQFNINASGIKGIYRENAVIGHGDLGIVITNTEPKKAQLFEFGFVRYWDRAYRLVNARSEGKGRNKNNDPFYTGPKEIISMSTWMKPIRETRCLIVADGFIEGTTREKLEKPHLVYDAKSDQAMVLAGIWERRMDKKTNELRNSFAIVTTPPNRLMQRIPHHRCPLVLEEENYNTWLHGELNEVTALMNPPNLKGFNAHPITQDIKKKGKKDKKLLLPTGQALLKEYEIDVVENYELFGMDETTARKRRNKAEELYNRKEVGRLKDPNDGIEIVFSYDPFDNSYYAKKLTDRSHYKPEIKIGLASKLILRLSKTYTDEVIGSIDFSNSKRPE